MARAPVRWIACAILALGTARSVPAAPVHGDGPSLPPFFELTPLAGSYGVPTGMAFTPGGEFLVAERSGLVRFHDGSLLQPTPFLDLRDEVNEDGDRGLLGLALHPGFVADAGATSWIYLLYTVSPVAGVDMGFDEDDKYSFSRLVRYRADTVLGDVVADLASREILLGTQLPDGTVPDGIASLHNSHSNGVLLFADDGSLIVSIGDGAHYNFMDVGGQDPEGFDTFVHPDTSLLGPMPIDQDSGAFRSQDLRSLAGKILRIDPETGLGYPSNPFFDGDPGSNASRVFALGLRNPFRCSLVPGTGSADPADGEPNTILIGDVGWGKWEELDVCLGGENFEWPCREGAASQVQFDAFVRPGANPYGYPDCQTPATGTLTAPLVAWHHNTASSVLPPGIHFAVDGSPGTGFTGSCAVGGSHYTAGGSYPAQYEDRYFFTDYSEQWLKTVEFDAQGVPIGIHDFGEDVGRLVSFARHPLNGDLYGLALPDPENPAGRVLWLRYDTNATPVAAASATPLAGDAPLMVAFDGSASSDPDLDPLDFLWDFGDGSPGSTDAVTAHTYTVDGIYEATLTVTDPGGRSGQQMLEIAVGNFPPTATILKPYRGLIFDANEVVQLEGEGTDTVPGELTFNWKLDLYHNDHVHPAFYQGSGATTAFAIEPHAEGGELYYYRVRLTVTDESGLTGTDSTFIYPRSNVTDVAETWTPISRVDELIPPLPTGEGNLDIEVMRDGDYPRAGQNNLNRQYDTFHDLEQGTVDWIGYEIPSSPGDELRFIGLSFVEGHNQRMGGWFDDIDVEVRVGGVWESVQGLTITPDYPFEFANEFFFNGVNFERYEIGFDPIFGEAIRMRGTPGGEDQFISVAELRCRTISIVPLDPVVVDVTDQGRVIARVLELVPPTPTGSGNPSTGTIRNRTRPPAGTQSPWAQYDTSHGGDQGSEDWIGYSFKSAREFKRLLFQEGLEDSTGGTLANIDVQVMADDVSPWQSVAGLTSSPPYPGDPQVGYERFLLDFTPTTGVAIRVVGVPQGSIGFFSVAELRAYALADPTPNWSNYCYCGVGPCNNLDPLSGCVHSNGEGARLVVAGGTASTALDDLVLQAVNLPPNKFGLIFMGLSQVKPFFGDGMRCAGQVQGRRPVRMSDASGRLTELPGLVQWAQTHGQILPGSSYKFQAWYRDPSGPCGLGFNLSNGLSVTFEP